MKIEITFNDNKKVNANINGHIVNTDQSQEAGGDNTAPTPYELFLASLGTCSGIFIKFYCDKRNIPADKIKIIQKTEFDKLTHLASKISFEIQLPSDFPKEHIEAIKNAAAVCKVKKQLQSPPQFEITTTIK
ncbi:MAG: OsmC family protein [Bacteroidales bacterium]|jgi:ribosomal protein S12 methylthiotransferase accessory factor